MTKHVVYVVMDFQDLFNATSLSPVLACYLDARRTYRPNASSMLNVLKKYYDVLYRIAFQNYNNFVFLRKSVKRIMKIGDNNKQ